MGDPPWDDDFVPRPLKPEVAENPLALNQGAILYQAHEADVVRLRSLETTYAKLAARGRHVYQENIQRAFQEAPRHVRRAS